MSDEPISEMDQLREIVRVNLERDKATAEIISLAHLVLDALPDGLIVTKASGEVVFFNSRAQHMFKYHRDQVIGRPIEMLLPERYRETHVRQRALFNDSDYAPYPHTMGQGIDIFGLDKDGNEFPIVVTLSQMITPGESGGMYDMASVRRAIPAATKEE